MRAAGGGDRHLGAYVVNRIDDDVEALEQRRGVFRGEEIVDGVNAAVRTEGQHTLGHGCHLGLTKGGIEGMRLAVDVGLGNVIEVDQGQPSDPAARERLHAPRADTADADHASVGHRQGSGRVRAIQTIDATKTTPGIKPDLNFSRRSLRACTHRTHHGPDRIMRAASRRRADCQARHRGLAR